MKRKDAEGPNPNAVRRASAARVQPQRILQHPTTLQGGKVANLIRDFSAFASREGGGGSVGYEGISYPNATRIYGVASLLMLL